jgi:NAD(P)-dependent dehydrogenase (short-subunit alcohol dehydrogenase family)
MVAIHEIRQTNADYYKGRPLVAVFVGGTQGIGRYAVEALAALYSRQPETALRVYILGRNKQSADQVLESCHKQYPRGEFIFVQANNLALISDVDATSEEIMRLERERANENPRIDLLVQTQAQILFGPRKDTGEGLDQMMSLVYYSRIRFIMQLMPLLEASDGAHIISIDAAGMAGKLFRDDLSLREPNHYSYVNVKSHAAYMTTVAFEQLASQHGGLALVYMYPGAVFGPSHRDPSLPWWFRAAMFIAEPLLRWTLATPPDESGARTLFLATSAFAPAGSHADIGKLARGSNGFPGSGSYAVGYQCDPVATGAEGALYPKLRDERFAEEVWHHTMETFHDIEKAGGTDTPQQRC